MRARQPFQDATDVLPYVQLTTTDGHVVRLSASHYLLAAVSPVAAPVDATMTPAGQVSDPEDLPPKHVGLGFLVDFGYLGSQVVRLPAPHYLTAVSPVAARADAIMTPAGQVF